MAELSRRSRQRNRHRNPRDVTHQKDFATAGTERDPAQPRRAALPTDPKSLANRDDLLSADEINRQEHTPELGQDYGQGLGTGPNHTLDADGSPRERDYRGNAGTTFGATVGPDALKSESADTRPDDKPAPNQ